MPCRGQPLTAPVSRFRRSYVLAASVDTNVGINGALAIYESRAVLDLTFLYAVAAKKIGTSNPPHQQQSRGRHHQDHEGGAGDGRDMAPAERRDRGERGAEAERADRD